MSGEYVSISSLIDSVCFLYLLYSSWQHLGSTLIAINYRLIFALSLNSSWYLVLILLELPFLFLLILTLHRHPTNCNTISHHASMHPTASAYIKWHLVTSSVISHEIPRYIIMFDDVQLCLLCTIMLDDVPLCLL